MNKKIILVLLSCYIYSAYAMQAPADQEAIKQQFIAAIRNDDVAGVRDAIAKGANTRDPLPMYEYDEWKTETPIKYVISKGLPNHLKIADLLLAREVKQEDLNALLRSTAYAGAVDRMLWLLTHGAKDENNEVRNMVINSIATVRPPYTASPETYREIIELLELPIEPKQQL